MNTGALGPGTIILVADPRDIDDLLKTIHAQRPQLFPGVPAMYLALSNHPDIVKFDLRSIETCISGAAPLPPGVQQQFQEITGARLVGGYGLSEASAISHSNPIYGPDRIGTIGLRWPDTEVKIVDTSTGELISESCLPGEMCVRGPQIMAGYWNQADETAVVGVPVEGKGEQAKSLVVLRSGEICTSEEILAFCRQNLAPYKVPKFVEFRDHLPKTQVGKVLRRQLIVDQAAATDAAAEDEADFAI